MRATLERPDYVWEQPCMSHFLLINQRKYAFFILPILTCFHEAYFLFAVPIRAVSRLMETRAVILFRCGLLFVFEDEHSAGSWSCWRHPAKTLLPHNKLVCTPQVCWFSHTQIRFGYFCTFCCCDQLSYSFFVLPPGERSDINYAVNYAITYTCMHNTKNVLFENKTNTCIDISTNLTTPLPDALSRKSCF